MNDIRHWITILESAEEDGSEEKYLLPEPLNIQKAKSFLLNKWHDRAKEWGRDIPNDLSGACKFASLFAQKLFGGKIRGNKNHQFVQLENGKVIDLTDDSRMVKMLKNPYKHDKDFWENNTEIKKSLKSCEPRVEKWVKEFTNDPSLEWVGNELPIDDVFEEPYRNKSHTF